MVAVAILALVTSPVMATGIAPEHARACILKAADTLPKIAGMKIGKSRTTSISRPANWASAVDPIQVDIDFTAAGQRDSWRYACSILPGGSAIVQRVAK
jgi:hypothetical protein